MVNMVLDQRAFGLLNRLLNRMKLLGDVHAGLLVLDHPYYACEVPIGTFQPLDDCWMGCMSRMFCHKTLITPQGGSGKWVKTHKNRQNGTEDCTSAERVADRRFGGWCSVVGKLPFGHP